MTQQALFGNNNGQISQQQREQLLRQQNATPKLSKMFPADSKATYGGDPNTTYEGASGPAFWEEMINHEQQQQNQQASVLINQSITDEYGSAQDFNNSIMHDVYKKVNEKISTTLGAKQDFTINGDPINMSQSMDYEYIHNNTDPTVQMIYSKGQAHANAVDPNSDDWIPDDQAETCYECLTEFNFFFRRHHCQICRKVFCKNCSSITNLFIDGLDTKLRSCKVCEKQSKKLTKTMQLQRSLLDDSISLDQRKAESDHFSKILAQEKPTTPMEIQQVGVAPEYYQQRNNGHLGNNDMTMDLSLDQSRDLEMNRDRLMSVGQFNPDESVQIGHDQTHAVARQSATNKRAIEKFLTFDQAQQNNGRTEQQLAKQEYCGNRVTDRRTNEWLNYKLRCHLDQMIDDVIMEHKIDSFRWRKIMANCTKHAVMTIRPSSRLLNDSINFNSFIKIVTIHHNNQEKCQYINGVVFKKDVASRRMRTSIENPKILLLNGSLGYVQETDGHVDMQAEINQQESFINIIRRKIQKVKPDIIFVEKDASRLALQTLEEDNITVVTVTSAKMLKMIARATQTIICPNINLLDRNFVVGQCLNFRVEQIKNTCAHQQNHQSLSETTSLMFLEGCQAKLGCSIALSGPDFKEIKQVRYAIKSCLKIARILLLERELFRFFVPEIEFFKNTISPDQVEENKIWQSSEPELTFQEEDQREDRVRFNNPRTESTMLRSSLLTNTDSYDYSQFESYCSPYLFHKHMHRDYIGFEKYKLVLKEKRVNDQTLPISNQAKQKKSEIFNPRESNRTSGDSDASTASKLLQQNDMTEDAVRKQLKGMCQRPKRMIMKFFDEAKDMSLFLWLDTRANKIGQNCSIQACKLPLVNHTDYYYHNDGCIKIKSVPRQDTNSQRTTFEQPKLQVDCKECMRTVIAAETIPSDLLEISFAKFLEQFFYNEKFSISTSRDQEYLGDHPACRHSLFRSGRLILTYGSTLSKIQFEQQDPYMLDLYHFGLQKGAVSDKQKQDLVSARLAQLRVNLLKTFNFILLKIEPLVEFMDSGIEEVKTASVIDPSQLETIKSQILAFLNKFKSNCGKQIQTLMQRIFGEIIDSKFIDRLIEMSSITEENTSVLNSIASQITTEMQFNRLHRIVSTRACEYLFALRQSYDLIKTQLIANAFPKKNPFSNIEYELNQQLAAAAATKVSSKLNESVDMFGIVQATPNLQKDLNFREASNSTSTVLSNSSAKALYKGLCGFEIELFDCEFIKETVSQNPFIPPGFNQNCIEMIKFKNSKGKLQLDIAGLIASALSSNLYLNGLAHLNYLNLPDNMKPFNGQFLNGDAHENNTENEIMMAATKQFNTEGQQNRVQLAKDVLNEKQSMEALEQELLQDTSYSFKLQFQTHSEPSKNEILLDNHKKKTIIEDQDDYKEFFSPCEKIADLESVEEETMPENIMNDIKQLLITVSQLQNKVDRGGSVKKINSVNLGDGQRLDTNNLQNRTSTLGANSQLSRGTTKRSDELQQTIDDKVSFVKAYSDIYHLYHDPVEYVVRVYCPKQFEALRKLYCGTYNDILHSLFRSELWTDNSGGKSASTFFKSFDNKYVLKAVPEREIKMFNDMSQSYFEYMSRSFTQQCPTAIAKTLGIFSIRIKHGKQSEHYQVILMENLLLNVDEKVSIKYDLKGSRRNRYIPESKQQQVKLDNNFLRDRKSRPYPMDFAMKRMLKIAIANDSLYLSKHSIIDYSMFVIINPETKRIRIGIIDYIQQYTFEKELESFVKHKMSSIKEDPTIIPPEAYKQRFRTAMDTYFVAVVPDNEKGDIQSIVQSKFGAKDINWTTKDNSEKTPIQEAMKAKIQSLIDAKNLV